MIRFLKYSGQSALIIFLVICSLELAKAGIIGNAGILQSDRSSAARTSEAYSDSQTSAVTGTGSLEGAESNATTISEDLGDALSTTDNGVDIATTDSTTRIAPNATIYLDIRAIAVEDEELTGDIIDVPLPKTKIFVLNKDGILNLPYIGRIPLAGLTESEAILRLQAEPLLENFLIELIVLPIEPSGQQALKPFGQELFIAPPSTFASAQDIPVPADYIIGSNDTVVIDLYGTENVTYELIVTREGIIDFPELGAILVSGLTFTEMKQNLRERINNQFIGVKSHITMGPLRTINVFIVGDANQPGSYTVSALSNMTNAIIVSGGISPVGSLRNIQLKRKGKVISRFDLYDLLLRGDSSADVRLHTNDVIFIPPVGRTVSVSGEVRRPAIYELRNEKTFRDVIRLTGGMLPAASPREVQLRRINQRKERILVDLDLSSKSDLEKEVLDGDYLSIPVLSEHIEDRVKLTGYAKRPGYRAWYKGMRLTDLIPSIHALLPKPDLDYVILRRHLQGKRDIEISSVRLGNILANPVDAGNIYLNAGDEIIIFGHEVTGDRQNKLALIIEELERQATSKGSAKIVNINGSVYEPGVYPLESGMRISGLIRAAGKLKEDAFLLTAELSRYTIVDGKYRETKHIPVNLSKVLQGDGSEDLELKPHDYLIIKRIPAWVGQQTVEITGEVKFPGIYPITHGEQISSVIERAGGLTDLAFPEGVIFSRVELQRKEEEQIQRMADRLETELKANILERLDEVIRPQETVAIAEAIIEQLRNAKSIGRLVVNLPSILASTSGGRRSDYDITLVDGDKLYIPPVKEEVSVIGEVKKSTTVRWVKGLTANDYISLSGGIGAKSKEKLVYVVRADGTVAGRNSSSVSTQWWNTSDSSEIFPGDTVVVPLDAEKLNTLKIWRDIAAIVAGFSLGVIAIDTIID